jgi:hypothetical protein
MALLAFRGLGLEFFSVTFNPLLFLSCLHFLSIDIATT